ncbi:hypothetical protein [Blattabacterium cuenoti]|nr:hypothetical protein [Blattabacterium cuenoti]
MKHGHCLFIDPILSFFTIENQNFEKSSSMLIGTIVKKKLSEHLLKEIK